MQPSLLVTVIGTGSEDIDEETAGQALKEMYSRSRITQGATQIEGSKDYFDANKLAQFNKL